MGRGLLPPAAVSGNIAAEEAKSSWPELVGRQVVIAVAVIKAQRQDVLIKILREDDDPPGDVDEHRVCLFLDHTAHVAKTPVVG